MIKDLGKIEFSIHAYVMEKELRTTIDNKENQDLWFV